VVDEVDHVIRVRPNIKKMGLVRSPSVPREVIHDHHLIIVYNGTCVVREYHIWLPSKNHPFKIVVDIIKAVHLWYFVLEDREIFAEATNRTLIQAWVVLTLFY
jgi:hypothetical protein